jgi:ribose transport system substrate-binding protein
MGNFFKKLRRRRMRRPRTSRSYSSSVRTVRGTGGIAPRKGRSAGSRRAGFVGTLISFLRRNIRLVAAGALVLVAGIVCLIIFTGGAKETSSPQPGATLSQSVAVVADDSAVESYSYADVDADTLAGLAGTDEDMFSEDVDMEEALLREEGVRIGVTVQDLPTAIDEALLGNMEALSNAAERSKRIYKTYYYNADGSAMQQIQDVHSLINHEVDVMIVGVTDAATFEKVCYMAAEAGILVVAYDAPATEGYEINVVTDQKAWGAVYGGFVAQQLKSGSVLQVLGSAENPVDQQRAAGISQGLAANPNLVLLETVYASWDKQGAYKAVQALIEGGARIDAVITEEGMAEGILDAFIEAGEFPAVMCGDVTAGFIQKWYALKHSGLAVKVEKEHKDDPEPTPMMLLAPFGQLTVCAQPAPQNAGAVAFEIAVRMAQGRTLKSGGQTFTYSVQTLITGANFSQYYETVKDQGGAALVRDAIPDAILEDLFEPAPEESVATE